MKHSESVCGSGIGSDLLRYLSLVVLLLPAACAWEGQYLVNTPSDFPDNDPGDGVCAGRSNLCSLRAAIEEANTHAAGDRLLISVPAGNYEVDGALALTHDRVVIRGDSRDTTTIDQIGSGERVLTITDPSQILVERVTLTGGNLSSPDKGGAVEVTGGGIFVVGFSECRISGNRAGWKGGGIYAEGQGRLNILNCIVEDNHSTSSGCSDGGGVSGGGGLMADGLSVTLYESEVRDNCGSNGGGVRLAGGADHVILQSTIAGNGSATRGGGLYTCCDASGRIEDSTIVDNSGPEAGGALITEGEFQIESTTITGNSSINTSDGMGGAGGIAATDGAQVSLQNTVVAENNGSIAQDCVGGFSSGGGNFIGNHAPDCDIAALPTDILDGGDPGLGALVSGIGPTRHRMPAANSELVDAGVPGCDPIDQRGEDAPAGAECDIGAVERQ